MGDFDERTRPLLQALAPQRRDAVLGHDEIDKRPRRGDHAPRLQGRHDAGDTAAFGDMRLIGELYRPAIAFLPIGDVYTMGPEQAAKACELVGVRQVVPMHYGTFPALTGTPARLRELVEPRGVQVLDLKPGETAA